MLILLFSTDNLVLGIGIRGGVRFVPETRGNQTILEPINDHEEDEIFDNLNISAFTSTTVESLDYNKFLSNAGEQTNNTTSTSTTTTEFSVDFNPYPDGGDVETEYYWDDYYYTTSASSSTTTKYSEDANPQPEEGDDGYVGTEYDENDLYWRRRKLM